MVKVIGGADFNRGASTCVQSRNQSKESSLEVLWIFSKDLARSLILEFLFWSDSLL